MIQAFLDTNILVDYIENRVGADAAERLFLQAYTGEVKLYASTLTFGNLAYVLRHHPQEEIYAALDEMETMIEVLPMDKQQLRKAIDHPSKDFEDMLQYQCAVAGGCECIVTRNKKDFKDFSALELFTADELADKI